jgi:polyhydroxyalkanoate synthesis regulator phasin
MALPAFDTHAYVKRLKAAGFNEAQAEAQAELQSEVLSSLVTEKLMTKEDGEHLKNELKQEIQRTEGNLKQNMEELRGKFNLLQWMVTFLLAGVVTILFKIFHL